MDLKASDLGNKGDGNMKMIGRIKIIDLLNKLANGEEVPKKIRYQFKTFELSDNEVYLRTDKVKDHDYGWKTLLQYVLEYDLNDEVEILEEEKQEIKVNDEKLEQYDDKIGSVLDALDNVLDETIDYLKIRGE